jgi:hypothetical protein
MGVPTGILTEVLTGYSQDALWVLTGYSRHSALLQACSATGTADSVRSAVAPLQHVALQRRSPGADVGD